MDIYLPKDHRGIKKKTPIQKWREGAAEFPPRFIANPHRLDITLSRTVERTLFHYGIELHNLRYNDDALLTIRRQHGLSTRVQVRYCFDDISFIYVVDPLTKEAIPVPALEQEYAEGLTMEQHRLMCARAREVNAGHIDTVALARAKAEIREAVRELSRSKFQRKRQRAASIQGTKLHHPPAPPPASADPFPSPVVEKHPPRLSDTTSMLPDIEALKFARPPKSLER